MAQPKSSSKARSGDARARAQAQREQIRAAERRRKQLFGGLWGAVALVVIAVVVFVVVDQIDTRKGGANVTAAATASVSNDITSIPESAFAAAGVQNVGNTVAGIKTIGGAPVLTGGLPTVIYVGAEFCPYCAAERWAIAATLSRFGTLSGLETTESSGTDEDPNTATLSFLTTTYKSPYIAFSGTEQEDRAHNLIKNPPAAEYAAFQKYGGDAYPFLTINDQYQSSVQYDPALLKGLTAAQIASDVKNDPTGTVGQAVLESANVLTAGVCAVTKQQPAAVCGASEVKAAAAYLNSAAGASGSSSGS